MVNIIITVILDLKCNICYLFRIILVLVLVQFYFLFISR